MDSKVIAVRSFTNDMEAEIAKAALEAFGIECIISGMIAADSART